MTGLAGTRALVRLALRRDRIMLPLWIAVFAGMAASSAAATIDLYPTAVSRARAAASFNDIQSLVALYGRIYDPPSVGGIALVKMGGMGAFFVALFAILVVVRHTRGEEEAGRLELLGATVVGRYAALTAALLVAIGASLALAAGAAIGLIATGLPADGSIAFGLAWAGVGISFAAVAGVTAQLTRSARTATGIAVAVLAGTYLMRAIGDTAHQAGPSALTWLSPIGWAQQVRPYAGDRWWVLLLSVALACAATAGAYVLLARRDLGAGLLPDRPGPPAAAASLRSPLALAWRLQRGALLGWAAGFTVLGLVFGNVASSIGDFATPEAQDLITKLGGVEGLVDAYIRVCLMVIGMAASAYGVQAAMRLRSEETGGRAESVLATATGRIGWAWSHVLIAVAGTTLLVAVGGAAAGIVRGVQTGDAGKGGAMLGGALAQAPAACVITGIVVALFGLAPRFVVAGWGILAAFVLLGELGPLFELDQRVLDVSPFAHVPRIPGDGLVVMPLVMLTVLAALLILGGLAGFRRRDIG